MDDTASDEPSVQEENTLDTPNESKEVENANVQEETTSKNTIVDKAEKLEKVQNSAIIQTESVKTESVKTENIKSENIKVENTTIVTRPLVGNRQSNQIGQKDVVIPINAGKNLVKSKNSHVKLPSSPSTARHNSEGTSTTARQGSEGTPTLVKSNPEGITPVRKTTETTSSPKNFRPRTQPPTLITNNTSTQVINKVVNTEIATAESLPPPPPPAPIIKKENIVPIEHRPASPRDSTAITLHGVPVDRGAFMPIIPLETDSDDECTSYEGVATNLGSLTAETPMSNNSLSAYTTMETTDVTYKNRLGGPINPLAPGVTNDELIIPASPTAHVVMPKNSKQSTPIKHSVLPKRSANVLPAPVNPMTQPAPKDRQRQSKDSFLDSSTTNTEMRNTEMRNIETRSPPPKTVYPANVRQPVPINTPAYNTPASPKKVVPMVQKPIDTIPVPSTISNLPPPNIPNYSAMTFLEQEQHRANFITKYGILRNAWPNYAIPEITPDMTLEQIHAQYDIYVRHIHINEEVSKYKIWLIIAWLLMEIFLRRSGLDSIGFTVYEISSMRSYESLLIQLGEINYKSSSLAGPNSDWPPHYTIFFNSLVSMITFIALKMLTSYVGPETANTIMYNVKTLLGGSTPQPVHHQHVDQQSSSGNLPGGQPLPQINANPLNAILAGTSLAGVDIASLLGGLLGGLGNRPQVPQPVNSQPANNAQTEPRTPNTPRFAPAYNE